MDRLTWSACFVRAVETGSFSAVARELKTSQPNVSRYIGALEGYLGVRLLQRSTRKLALTPEGARYYEGLRHALDALGEAEASVQNEGQPSGRLRVACPVALARFRLLPLVKPFLARYPAIELDLLIGDRKIDLVEEGVDVAIRVGELTDSSLHARRLALATQVCAASAEYLGRRGEPRTPADLKHHNCIEYSLLATAHSWPFEGEPVAIHGNFRVNSAEGVRAAVLDGIGVGLAPFWLFEDALADGRARALLTRWRIPPLPIHAVYPANRWLPQRAGVFVDFLANAATRAFSLSSSALRSAG